jgi:hypothetical protein
MPKSAKKSKSVKRATAAKVAKPKMMMTRQEAGKLCSLLRLTEDWIVSGCPEPVGSRVSVAVTKRMIACADALYKAAGVR